MDVGSGCLPQEEDAGPSHGEGKWVRVNRVRVPVEAKADSEPEDAAETSDHRDQETVHQDQLESPGPSPLARIPHRDVTNYSKHKDREIGVEGGDDDGETEGETQGYVDGGSLTPQPVAHEGVVQGREAEEEDAEESKRRGQGDGEQRPPVEASGPFPGLIVRQLVEAEHGPVEAEAGHQHDVGNGVQESGQRRRGVGHDHFSGDVRENLKIFNNGVNQENVTQCFTCAKDAVMRSLS